MPIQLYQDHIDEKRLRKAESRRRIHRGFRRFKFNLNYIFFALSFFEHSIILVGASRDKKRAIKLASRRQGRNKNVSRVTACHRDNKTDVNEEGYLLVFS